MQPRRRRRSRAFTLVEMMVASAIALIIIGAGTLLASAMVRSVKKIELQGELSARVAVAHAFVQSVLSPTAYNWAVDQEPAAGTSTGSFGTANCVAATGICTGALVKPLEICRSTTVSATVCDASLVSTADALKTIVPRDPLIEAVQIRDRGPTSSPSLFAAAEPCVGGLVLNPIVMQVRGVNTTAWAVGDLVAVSTKGHTTIGAVTEAFATGADPAVSRDLSLNLGLGTALVNDDGNSADACDGVRSLRGAQVMRVKLIVLKQDAGARTLLYGEKTTAGGSLTFTPVASGVDDLQFQLEIARFPAAGAATLCRSNTTAIFEGAAYGAAPATTCVSTEKLTKVTTVAANRVLGLHVGLILRTPVETENAAVAVPGLFDRTATITTDARLRRNVFLYVGLPNASSF